MVSRKVWVPLAGVCIAVCVYVLWPYTEERSCAQRLYARALQYEATKRFRDEYAIQHFFCNSDPPLSQAQLDHACDRSGAVGTRVDAAYEATMRALEDYRATHGAYPESLEPVLAEMPQEIREVAREFDYYRKPNPAEKAAVSSDGRTIFDFSDSGIVLVTGQYGTVSFDLAARDRSLFQLRRSAICSYKNASAE
jgi:hypothetical protein